MKRYTIYLNVDYYEPGKREKAEARQLAVSKLILQAKYEFASNIKEYVNVGEIVQIKNDAPVPIAIIDVLETSLDKVLLFLRSLTVVSVIEAEFIKV